MCVRGDFLAEVQAADVRKDEIEHDDLWRILVDLPQRIEAVACVVYLEAGQRQRGAVHTPPFRIMINEQNLVRARRHDSWMIRASPARNKLIRRLSSRAAVVEDAWTNRATRDTIWEYMSRPRVLLIVDRPDLRAGYEMILRLSGYELLSLEAPADLDHVPADVVAACILTDHGPAGAAACSKLLAAAVPVVRIDPFIRHAREHLPFDVVLPVASEPRQLISALRHLLH